MSVETEAQKKILDTMEAERQLKLGRALAKFITPFIWVNIVLTLGVWVLSPQYIQLLVYGILIVPVAAMLMLQHFFEVRGRSTLWAALYSMSVLFLLVTVPFFIPESSLAAAGLYGIILLEVGLLWGTRPLLFAAGISRRHPPDLPAQRLVTADHTHLFLAGAMVAGHYHRPDHKERLAA